MLRIFSIVILLLHSFASEAKYEELVGKTFAQRLPQLRKMYEMDLRFGDSASVFREITAIEEVARKHKDEDLLCEVDLLTAHYFYYKAVDHRRVIKMLNDLSRRGKDQGRSWVVARAENVLGLYYYHMLQQYEAACEHFQRMYDVLRLLEATEFPYKQFSIYHFAEFYYNFAEYPMAVRYLHEALATPPISSETDWNVILNNTLGLCYRELNMLDSSDHYFKAGLSEAIQRKGIEWECIISGNLGHNHMLRGNYAAARPLLQKDLDLAINIKDWSLASGSLMDLANINIKTGDLARAASQLEVARQYVYASGQYKRLQTLYPLLSKLYALTGKPAYSVVYLDSALYVRDSITRKFNALLLLRAQQRVEREQQRVELTGLEAERRLKLLQRNVLIGTLIALMGLSAYILTRLRKKQQLGQAQLREKEGELQSATTQLEEFTKYLSEKNQVIESLQDKVGTEHTEAVLQLQQTTILTDAEWEYFQRLFEKVHGDYLLRLKEKLPGLTPAETRIVALSKLRLSNKEMANALGVGTGAIRQNRSRLRRKLNISEEDNWEAIIDSI